MDFSANNQTDSAKQHPFLVITVVALMTFMGVLTETSMNVTFPTLMKQFNISLPTVQWVTTGIAGNIGHSCTKVNDSNGMSMRNFLVFDGFCCQIVLTLEVSHPWNQITLRTVTVFFDLIFKESRVITRLSL